MKSLSYLLLASLPLFSGIAQAAQTAQARLYCISIRLSSGRDEYGDILNVTSTGNMDAGVGDLAPYQNPGSELLLPGGETYVSNISLYDTGTASYLGGSITISIDPRDSDGNRFPDFFEISKSVNMVRPYGMMDVYSYGRIDNVSASWTRSAGSRTGNCVIAVADGYFGIFRHTFEVMEYKGTLTYTPATNSVSGTLNLVQTGNAANTFQAPVQFVKSATDHFNQLTLLPGNSTGTLLSTVHSFTNHVFTRDSAWPTNYAGFIEFSDGDPWTFEPYAFWVLSITDINDTDGNGIPDFSDDPALPPRAARLSLAVVQGGLQLAIQGDVGRQYEIQATTSLGPPGWQTVQTVTLNADPQLVTLPLPSTTTFWRVVGH